MTDKLHRNENSAKVMSQKITVLEHVAFNWIHRHALSFYLSMSFCEKPVSTFSRHALENKFEESNKLKYQTLSITAAVFIGLLSLYTMVVVYQQSNTVSGIMSVVQNDISSLQNKKLEEAQADKIILQEKIKKLEKKNNGSLPDR